jgi:hypothetical protein
VTSRTTRPETALTETQIIPDDDTEKPKLLEVGAARMSCPTHGFLTLGPGDNILESWLP